MVGDIITYDITANFSNGAVASTKCVYASIQKNSFPASYQHYSHFGVPNFEFYVKPTLVSPAPTYSLTCSSKKK